jgi:rRNA maturation RNase YbeY
MIEFFSETEFRIENKEKIARWINHIIKKEGFEQGEISYVFCDDDYLLRLNEKYLEHDTLTDILTFDSSNSDRLNGDIFISVERVKENAKEYTTTFSNELHRVMIHGILHLCGYKDKSETESKTMKRKEDEALLLLKSL